MSKTAKKGDKAAKQETPKLTFRVIRNTNARMPSDDRFTLSKDNTLLFNATTRTKLNIALDFAEFFAANEPGEERNVYLRFHKTKVSSHCSKVSRLNDSYFKLPVPSAAVKEVGMIFKSAGERGKRKRSIVHYKGESIRFAPKNRMLKLTPVED